MFGLIKNKAANIKRNLTSLDSQPIGKAALTIILFLDFFILISIFDGLADHTRQLASPSQLVPQYCRDIVIDGDWNETNRLKELARHISTARGSYYQRDKRERTRERHVVCEPITRLFIAIEDDNKLSANLKELLRVKNETKQLNTQIDYTKGAYDTSLLENIADQDNSQASVDSLKKDMTRKTSSVNRLVQKRESFVTTLQQDKKIQDLFTIVDNVTEADRVSLRDDLRQLNFWYPLKRLGMEFIFLLPLFVIFYLWNKWSLKAHRPFQSLVSTHLLVIAFLPAIFKILELVYDIIPKKLMKQIFDLLESFNLVALWHYFVMAASIIAALALVYLFQKKLFSREKLVEKRISKGACQECGKHLPANSDVCTFCGFKQLKDCTECNKPTYTYGKYCCWCGHSE